MFPDTLWTRGVWGAPLECSQGGTSRFCSHSRHRTTSPPVWSRSLDRGRQAVITPLSRSIDAVRSVTLSSYGKMISLFSSRRVPWYRQRKDLDYHGVNDIFADTLLTWGVEGNSRVRRCDLERRRNRIPEEGFHSGRGVYAERQTLFPPAAN